MSRGIILEIRYVVVLISATLPNHTIFKGSMQGYSG